LGQGFNKQLKGEKKKKQLYLISPEK